VNTIGRLNETSLHEQLKYVYAGQRGLVEQLVDGFVVDVLVGNEIVEVQTGSMLRLRRKLEHLVTRHTVRIVHPIAARTRIVKTSPGGELVSSRRSPKRGRLEEAFREITSIADLLPHRNIVVDLVMVSVVEIRCDDGRGSWRRKGVSVVERKLDNIEATITLASPDDYVAMLPDCAGDQFTNRDLCTCSGLPYRIVQPMTSSLKKMGLLAVCGRRAREQLFARV
jgi:hypothetical protein